MRLARPSAQTSAGLSICALTALVALGGVVHPSIAYAADPPVDLATASSYSVLGGQTVTNTGPSFLAQNLGVSPGTEAPGFLPGQVAGETHLADAASLQAQTDLTSAYTDAAGRTPFTSLAVELGGTTLTPGVYRLPSAQLTGTLTLDTQGDPAAVFIFQIDATLITGSDSQVVFLDEESTCSVYWQVASSATLGTDSSFIGTIMASTAISLETGADLEGRALAQTAAVTLDDNIITAPVCDVTPPTPPAVDVPPVDVPPAVAPPVVAPPATVPSVTVPSVPAAPVPDAGVVSPVVDAPTVQATPAATPPPADTVPAGPQLPVTGTSSVPLAAAAAALTLVGVGLLAVRRRRSLRS